MPKHEYDPSAVYASQLRMGQRIGELEAELAALRAENAALKAKNERLRNIIHNALDAMEIIRQNTRPELAPNNMIARIEKIYIIAMQWLSDWECKIPPVG